MRYKINGIRLDPEEYRDEGRRLEILRQKTAKKTGAEVSHIEILKESIDARKKPAVVAVYSLAFESDRRLRLDGYEPAADWTEGLEHFDGKRPRPVIAGFGPCGIFAALVLARQGAKPIVIERGKAVDQRIEDVERFWNGGEIDPESNVQFGEGGAGTFSDGKLNTGIRDERIKWILGEFVGAGADPAIMYRNRPHIGTDKLRKIVPVLRKKIIDLGGEVRFSTRLTGIEHEEGRLTSVITSEGRIRTDDLILATGHSARDTFRMLVHEGITIRPKPFSIGLRVQHLQKDIDRAQYGDADLAKVFGPAEYRLSHRCADGRGVYTFCMCPGGRVINASSGEHQAVTNGMSDHSRDGMWANSGLLVDVRVEDFDESEGPLAGVEFQRRYERLAWEHAALSKKDDPAGTADNLPVSTYGRFRDDREDIMRKCLPDFAVKSLLEAMPHLGRKLKGFDSDDTLLTAVETRSSSPVRIERDGNMHTEIRGLIPAGEGPGYAGGIISAAVDGIKAAEAVIRG